MAVERASEEGTEGEDAIVLRVDVSQRGGAFSRRQSLRILLVPLVLVVLLVVAIMRLSHSGGRWCAMFRSGRQAEP